MIESAQKDNCNPYMTPQEYCQQKAARSGSNFYYSFLILSDKRRDAITALYAFCREVDDIVDTRGEPHIKQVKLDWWRQELQNLYHDQPQHPISLALQPCIHEYSLAQEHFQEIIDGMEMDLQQTRYEEFKDLNLYCHRAAGVVGILAAEIFGYEDRRTLKYAHNLGIAFQLTNIIRDVGEDIRQDRLYLPLQELSEFGVSEDDIRNGRHTEAFDRLIQKQVKRAMEYYQLAMDTLPEADRYNQRAGLIMAAIYRQLLERIEQKNRHVLDRRIGLGTLQKIWIAWQTARRENRRYRRYTRLSNHA